MDDQGDVDALLVAHAESIAAVRTLVRDVLTPDFDDDIWLMRFVMSNGSPAACEEPIRATIHWRTERAEILGRIRAGAKAPWHDEITKYQVVGDHKYTARGEPLFYVRVGLCNAKSLLRNVAYNDILEYMLLSRESMVAYLEATTRATRRLVKGINVLDFAGFSLTTKSDPRFTKLLGECSQLAETMYPQMVGRSILLNTPSLLSWMFRVIKPWLNPATLANVVVCPGGTAVASCPYLSAYLKLDDVPTFLGGRCVCDGNGCIGNIPNSQTRPLLEYDADGRATLLAAARATERIEVAVRAGRRLLYDVGVPGKPVDVAVTFRPLDAGQDGIVVMLFQQRLGHTTELHHDAWDATSDGVVTIAFSNTAYYGSRAVQYRTEVVVVVDTAERATA
ncbi:hypothetical protein SPRG_00267 [Saprolegnia parasitica CBS 223.65]|uniref:CRAL-TRIO domain-containing protein n=1 Tax=Saprolegnia parasitica (strain CBS 223.65) TaxID=695850 RepID=A0A067CXH7_SAPPC|nr:hypothetical protein SPRG_00267 [Saprolegnia parasitica CBS 223.65]KDO35419.1 hypothetical protein SPRG_00267 [Saprolegnia parasitica CBS 223.65]|eukprot:XP_012193759.1 hypothetical protein SPRG_00267 [Saprolegnia parasitica CBS 223.65]